jgi:hypothetical protein
LIRAHRNGRKSPYEPLVTFDHAKLNAFIKMEAAAYLRSDRPVLVDGAHCARHGVAVKISWDKFVAETQEQMGWKTFTVAQNYAELGRSPRVCPSGW